MSTINENLKIDIDTEIMDINREYQYNIDIMPHTKDYELTIIWNDDVFGEYLYNSKQNALSDIDTLLSMGFNITEL